MAQRLTDNQLLHRQYLQSPVWKAKRGEALAHYGPICARCEEHGTDVHHKTYERVGGAELMEDLEVLCRECHEAHHRAERASRQTRPAKVKSVNRRAIFQYLTHTQRTKLIADFRLSGMGELAIKVNHSGSDTFVLAAARLLGFNNFHGGPTNRRDRSRPNCWRSKEPRPEPERYISFAEFKRLPNPFCGSGTA